MAEIETHVRELVTQPRDYSELIERQVFPSRLVRGKDHAVD